MKRSYLEKHINKRVTIVFFDNFTVTGLLAVGNGFFYVPKLYHLNDEKTGKGLSFRCSHVKKLVVKE